MEEFRKKISKRVLIISLFTMVYIFLYIIFIKYIKSDDRVLGLAIGMVIGIEIVICFLNIKYRKALKNEDELKKLYNYENDERRRFVKEKTSKTTLLSVVLTLPIFTIIFGVNNYLIFKVLLMVLFYIFILFFIFKLYYMKKY